MKLNNIILALLCLLIPTAAGAVERAALKPFKVAAMCFSTGEQISGMNKICFYNCLGSAAAITVSSVALCPLSINR